MIAWLLYAAILFPTIGSVVDHHFAERQPSHLHSGAVVLHVHNYARPHSHTDQASHGANAVFNFESIETISFFHTGGDLGLTAFSQFRPDSTFALPSSPTTPMLELPAKSPDRPPQAIA